MTGANGSMSNAEVRQAIESIVAMLQQPSEGFALADELPNLRVQLQELLQIQRMRAWGLGQATTDPPAQTHQLDLERNSWPVLRSLSKIARSNTANVEDFRQGLAEFLPAATILAAEAFGTNSKEFLEALERGQVAGETLAVQILARLCTD